MTDIASNPPDRSWLDSDAIAYEKAIVSAPALKGQRDVDIAVVGGGFAGMWTALAPKAREARLTIVPIDAQTRGSGANGKDGGMVSGHGSRSGKMAALFLVSNQPDERPLLRTRDEPARVAEPSRSLGARAQHRRILRTRYAEAAGRTAASVPRTLAVPPQTPGPRIGTR